MQIATFGGITMADEPIEILYLNTNFNPQYADIQLHCLCPSAYAESINRLGQLLHEECKIPTTTYRGILTLLKDHPFFNENGKLIGIYDNKWGQKAINPTLPEIIQLFKEELLLAQPTQSANPNLLMVDYCHSYQQLTLSFPEVLEGLQSAGYEVNHVTLIDPKYLPLAEKVKDLPRIITQKYEEDISYYESELQQDLSDQLRTIANDSLKRIKDQRERELAQIPSLIRGLENNFNWPVRYEKED
jgi:hypothetical protein